MMKAVVIYQARIISKLFVVAEGMTKQVVFLDGLGNRTSNKHIS